LLGNFSRRLFLSLPTAPIFDLKSLKHHTNLRKKHLIDALEVIPRRGSKEVKAERGMISKRL
jgi:hypothetical protein